MRLRPLPLPPLVLLVLLLSVLGLAGRAAAQGDHGARQQPSHAEAEGQEPGDAHHAVQSTLEMPNDQFFKKQYSHSVPYVWYRPEISNDPKVNKFVEFYNVNGWQWVGLVLLAVLFVPVLASFRSGRPSWLTRVFRGWCLWVRDEMVYSVMGKEEGRAFVPYFLFIYFWVTAMNVVGLIPSVGHTFAIYTATGTPYVTAGLALITFAMMLGFGMKKNGVFGFFKGLLPHGLPLPLIPLMVVVELIGLIVKPFALTIRLFANMLAGHLVIASAIGLIFLFAKLQGGAITSYLTALPCVGMAVFVYIIEAFVTLLQAYIFCYLSIIFIHLSVHQEH